ncbi:hypothetical protein HP436_08780 [Pseudomonas sp. CrR14]|nr:hypothetical protein [Pseudomonas sp. CrR14]
MINMQSAIIAELIQLLQSVPDIGSVEEDDVLGIIDSEDESLPNKIIVIQEGATEEVERAIHGSVREAITLNIAAVTSIRNPGPWLRETRLAIKVALAGPKAGLKTAGVQSIEFQPETPMPARDGRRWACRVIPVRVSYVQPLK